MEPKHLVQLAAIIDSGTINAAAARLNITQPTLTRNIQTLEMQAGGSLFTRSRHGVSQTELGATLAREGRAIAKSIWSAQQASIRHGLGMKQEVRIGVGPLLANSLMHNVTARLLEQHPDLSLLVRVDTPYRLIEQLHNDELDVVISPKVLSATQDLTCDLLFEDKLCVFTAASHPLAHRKQLTVADLNGYDWVNMGTYARFDASPVERLQRAGVTDFNTPLALAGDAMICLNILPTGRYLCLMPNRLTQHSARQYGLVRLDVEADFGERDIFLWYPSTERGQEMIEAIRTIIDQELQPTSSASDNKVEGSVGPPGE